MFAHKIFLSANGSSILVDGVDKSSSVDVVSLNERSLPFNFSFVAAKSQLTIADEYSVADVEMDDLGGPLSDCFWA